MNFQVSYQGSSGKIDFNELLEEGLLYIGRYPSKFYDNIAVYVSKMDKPVFLHDIQGIYRDVAPVYLDVGYDLRIDLFSKPDLLLFSMKATLDYHGLRNPYWYIVFLESIYTFNESDDRTLDGYIRFLSYRVGESSGIEKMGYVTLYHIFTSLFHGSLQHIFSYEEYSVLKGVSTPVYIGYNWIDNEITKNFLLTYISLYLAKEYPSSYHVVPYADIHSRIPWTFLHSIFPSGNVVFQSTSYREGLASLVKYIVFDALHSFDKAILRRLSLPEKYLDSEYLMFDRNIVLQVIPSDIKLERIKVEPMEIDSLDYMDRYRDVVMDILDLIYRFGEVSIDGIYIQLSKYDMPLIASLVDRLWREGFLRRLPMKGGVRYRLTLKGIKFLRGGVDE